MPENIQLEEWGSLFPYFRHTAADVDNLIANSVQEVTIPAGTVAFRQQDECKNYLLVLEGSVKVLARSESGREIVLYRVQRGNSCVLTTSCLLAGSHYPAEGVTETEVRALAIPAPVFRRGLAESVEFRNFVFDSYGKRLTEMIALVGEISFGNLNRRLARCLLQHANDKNELKTTHQTLATELGSAREVISRHLKDFEQKGWITQQRGHLQICNPDALQALAEIPL